MVFSLLLTESGESLDQYGRAEATSGRPEHQQLASSCSDAAKLAAANLTGSLEYDTTFPSSFQTLSCIIFFFNNRPFNLFTASMALKKSPVVF